MIIFAYVNVYQGKKTISTEIALIIFKEKMDTRCQCESWKSNSLECCVSASRVGSVAARRG